MPIIVKGIIIDNEAPLVCVPVTDAQQIGIIDSAKRLRDAGVKCIEWRADFYEDLLDSEKLRDTLEMLRDITGEIVLIVTVRTRPQGGNIDLTSDGLSRLLIEIATAHCADFIDMEYFNFERPLTLIGQLHEKGAFVIASWHDFNKTPEETEMMALLSEMKGGDPDIVKLAVMPGQKKDVFSLMKVVSEFKEIEKIPVIAMSMGQTGAVSRIVGEAFGSCITFGKGKDKSAPGQIDFEKLSLVTKRIHECL
ncbi:MAG: type I 3-dehydroquinate dehydratase [Lachnospiraceae bacterium]|nr:type I 3-dehydroquinate dehydratase [Lachnospiraceae bacterium]